MTPRQKKCFDMLMYHFDKSLDELMQFDGDIDRWVDRLDQRLDQSENVVDVVSAGATLGLFLAPVTGGVSLAVTAVCGTVAAGIKIGKLVNGCVRTLATSFEESSPKFDSEAAFHAFKLSIRVGLMQISHAIVVYYSHIINDIMEECSIPTFADYGASRVLKKLKVELKKKLIHVKESPTPLKVILMPDIFIEYLLQSVTLSMKPEKIFLRQNEPGKPSAYTMEMPVKWAFSRSRFILPIKQNTVSSRLELAYYASAKEGRFLSDSSLECYGYTMLQSFYDRSASIVMNHRRYELLHAPIQMGPDVRKHLTFYYVVTIEDIQEYLKENAKHPTSLNQYLTHLIDIPVIAVIQGDILSRLDLSFTDFSNVIGCDLKIEKSNLKGSRWDSACLPHSVISEVETDEMTSFADVSFEFSEFSDFVLTGNWSKARLNFLTLTRCGLSTKMIDKMADWSWFVYRDLYIKDEQNELLASESATSFEKIEANELRLEELFHNKYKEMQNALKHVQENEQLNQMKIAKWRAEQKAFEARYIEVQQALLKEIYLLKTQPESNMMAKAHARFDLLYKSVISQPHVDLFIRAGNQPKVTTVSFLSSLIEKKESFSVVVFEGALGSGKTTDIGVALMSLKTDLEVDAYDVQADGITPTREDEWIFDIFSLWKISSMTDGDLLTACLKTEGYTSEEIQLLKRRRCLFVLDGLEDCGINFLQHHLIDEIYKKHNDWDRLILVLTVTTEFRKKHTSFYEKMGYGSFSALPEDDRVRVLPFNKEQIDAYFRLYFPKQLSLQDINFSNQLTVKEIYKMAKIPIMAHIICEVFAGKSTGYIPETPIQFCKAFIKIWHANIHEKAKNLNLPLLSVDIEDFIKTIAFEMFKQKQIFIDRPFETERGLFQTRLDEQKAVLEPSLLALIFTDPKCKKAGTLMPLSVDVVSHETQVMLRYKFIHKLIYFFSLAIKLIDILQNEPIGVCQVEWNHDLITEVDIFLFMEACLRERIKDADNTHAFIEKLKCMVKASTRARDTAIAASNAMTFLNTLHYDFSRNIGISEWRGISVPWANLKRAKLSGLDMSGSDFRNVSFHHAEIADTNLQGSNVSGARFLSSAERHHYVMKRPKAMTRYENDTLDVITYAVPSDAKRTAHHIVNFGLDGKKYPTFEGHQTEIICLSWGVKGLLSSSRRGTIYYWSAEGKKIHKFKHMTSTPVYSLSWHSDGDIFVSGGEDGCLYLWDIRRSDSFLQKFEEGGALYNVFLGASFLFTGGALGELHVRSYRYRNEQFSLAASLDRTFVFNHPISSMAVSPNESCVALGLQSGQIALQEPSASNVTNSFLSGHRHAVRSVSWHKNGEMLFSGGDDGSIRSWNVIKKQCLSVLYGDGTPIERLCILADGRRVLATQDRMLSVWQMDKLSFHENAHEEEVEYLIRGVIAYNSGCVTAHSDGSVWEWSFDELGKKSRQLLYKHDFPIQQIVLLPGEEQHFATLDVAGHVGIWYRETSSVCMLPPINDKLHVGSIHWIRDTINNFYLALACDFGVYIFDVSTQKNAILKTIIQEDSQYIAGQTLSSKFAVSNGTGVRIFSYYGNDNVILFQAFSLPKSKVLQMTWSANGAYLAVMDEEFAVYIFDVNQQSLECLDSTCADDKKMAWFSDANRRDHLLIGSLEEIKLIARDQERDRWGRAKRLSSGAEYFAVSGNTYYLADKMSVDVMSLKGEQLLFVMRIGSGLCTRGTNLTNTKSLREDEIKALETHGAILSKSWIPNFSFFSREPVHPLPTRTSGKANPNNLDRLVSLKDMKRLSSTRWSVDDETENSSPHTDSMRIDIAAGPLSRKESSPAF